MWSLKEHVAATGSPFVDLTGDDGVGPSGVKEEDDSDAGPSGGVKAETGWEDYTLFYLLR